ncbi:XdhC family protein [Pedomonas mirosovicensis]|uniref:XdhC family protein n=1 Tax=Pedomonas mirosovicensis TaxID=2908641 RepID=UPI002166D212|nr:XdhC family protein [Pedomonas mirosovicensis]MCH8685232.1 XdhC family protein [Pedomonas mirosovicensis]
MAETTDETAFLFTSALTWLAEGHRVALATVIETWGSAPRRTGSHMVLRADGLFQGSVSGGCVEGDVIVNAQEALAQNRAVRLDYGVSNSEAWQVGLACGGRICVLVQPVDDEHFAPRLMRRILAERQAGRGVMVRTHIPSGQSEEAEPGAKPGEDEFLATYEPPLRVAIIGAVHIAQALVPMVTALGYAPFVIDPRGAFAAGRFVGLDVSPLWPDEALRAWCPDSRSAVITLTHDPKLDDPALVAALQSPAFYIAALGSRKTHAARLERLKAHGFGEEDCARIHGPAGLNIGARAPAEIALSIAAQMTAALRRDPEHAASRQGDA